MGTKNVPTLDWGEFANPSSSAIVLGFVPHPSLRGLLAVALASAVVVYRRKERGSEKSRMGSA